MSLTTPAAGHCQRPNHLLLTRHPTSIYFPPSVRPGSFLCILLPGLRDDKMHFYQRGQHTNSPMLDQKRSTLLPGCDDHNMRFCGHGR